MLSPTQALPTPAFPTASRLMQLFRFASATVFLLLAFQAGRAGGHEEDEPARPHPGLRAEYFRGGTDSKPAIARYEPVPAFELSATESPDSRLAVDGWRAQWRGVLDIQQPGNYQVSAIASGALRIAVGGEVVLEFKAATEEAVTSRELELAIGPQPLTMDFRPNSGAKHLKLYWQSSNFEREPLPAFALGHSVEHEVANDGYLAGRLAIEEHNCASCHRPTEKVPVSLQLKDRPAPRLETAGSRLNAAWIYEWLGNPQTTRPEAVMPRLFGDGRQAEIERYVVARFLAGGSEVPNPSQIAETERERLVTAGKTLYQRTGCVVCHEKQLQADDVEIAPRASLIGLGHKLAIDQLAAFIEDPYAVDRSGRMPKFGLAKENCRAIAAYLANRDLPTTELPRLPQAPTEAELRDAFAALAEGEGEREGFDKLAFDDRVSRLARQVIRERRCANCHDFGSSNDELLKQRPASDFARIVEKTDRGCLAAAPSSVAGSNVLRFGAALNQAAVAAFLKAARDAAGTPSPGEMAELTVARFNCTGCHQRNAVTGLSASMMRLLSENQTAAEAELVRPPTLTGITSKLRAEALRAVLLEGVRSRPWMALKMPQFNKEDIEQLPHWLAAADGDRLSTDKVKLAVNPELAAAGRALVGSQGFGCIKCHDIRGIVSTGTRGPDLARVTDRIEHDWYQRWMTDPQRIEPGTRMPTVFFGGQSPYKTVLEGDPGRQSEAIWQYLAGGEELELPDGLEPTKLRPSTEATRPLVMRTFLPGVSPRGLAIQFPNRVHLAFDAQSCRLAYAWQGDFLDLGPVWTGRGGRPAEILGPQFWVGPPGFPWAIRPTSFSSLPDFVAQATDTELGAQPPDDGKVYPSRLRFRGYRLNDDKVSLRYELDLGSGSTARFEEQLATIARSDAIGVRRQAQVSAPADSDVWLQVGNYDQPPKAALPEGTAALDPPEKLIPATTPLVVTQDGKPTVIRFASPSGERAAWVTTKQGDGWALMARAPIPDGNCRMTLTILKPANDRPQTIERLLREPLTDLSGR